MLAELQESATPNFKHLIERCPDKPKYLTPLLDRMPLLLRQYPIWVFWKAEWKLDKKGVGRWSKSPFRVHRPRCHARTNDVRTWVRYEEAVDRWPYVLMDGFGIMLRFWLVGFDIDNCVDPHSGVILPDVKDILDFLGAYCEYSPSRTGIKALFLGSLAELASAGINVRDLPHKKKFPSGFEVEVYDHDSPRYFTITGHRVEGYPDQITDCQDRFRTLYRGIFQDEIPRAVESGKRRERAAITNREVVNLAASDSTVIELASCARNAGNFLALYRDGSLASHQDDHSRADLGLCQHLVFWCGDDSDRIDRLFRSSALMRDKWEREDYRARTIDRAISQQDEHYDWSNRITLVNLDGRLDDVFGQPTEAAAVPPAPEPERESEAAEPKPAIHACRDHPLFRYLWQGNHFRITDEARERRMRSVVEILDLIPKSGFFYDYVAAQLPSCDCSVTYHLASALTIAGHACNRKLKVQFGNKAILPNIWACVLGASTVAHKSSSITAGREMLCTLDDETIISDAFSFESLLDQIGIIVKPSDDDPRSLLIRAREQCKSDEENADLCGVPYSPGLGFFHGNELGAWLQTLEKSPGSKQSLTDLYDNKPEYSKRTRGTGLYYVPRPFLSILMASTKEWLVENSSESDIQGGFLPRWLFFNSDSKDYIGGIPDPSDPDQIDKAEKSFAAMASRSAHVPTCDANETTDFYANWRVKVEERFEGDNVMLSWVSRMGDTALKVAVLYEASTTDQDLFTSISVENMRRATRLMDLLLKELKETLRSIVFTKDGKDLGKVRGLIQAAGQKGIAHSVLLRRSKFSAKDLTNFVSTLEQSEEIRVKIGKVPEGGGSQPKAYQWIA